MTKGGLAITIERDIEILYEYRHIDDHLDIDEINAALDRAIDALKEKLEREKGG